MMTSPQPEGQITRRRHFDFCVCVECVCDSVCVCVCVCVQKMCNGNNAQMSPGDNNTRIETTWSWNVTIPVFQLELLTADKYP
jgi:heme/copper-type cytochrome/quinol oxidase subunit 2